ncbi:MAG: GyrI-like domain-containing protein [Anaerolineae bacterium]|nr:GyrI-like domain-containing protein [Anaerolineae bacterium]
MPSTQSAITTRTVGDMRVASIRFEGDYADIPRHFEQLRQQIAAAITGPGICLYHNDSAEKGHALEVCFPVSEPVENGDITTRTLPGAAMLCITHTGAYDALPAAWRKLVAFMRQHDITISMAPAREVHHDINAGQCITEIQLPLMLPVWMGRLADGLERTAGADARRHILAGSEYVTPDTPAAAVTAWVRGVMDRLDAAVDENTIRQDIMPGCAHRFPQSTIARLRDAYERLGTIDALIAYMRDNPHVAAPVREGRALITTKVPYNTRLYKEATDPVEKRAAYCHCGIIRSAIRAGEPLSTTFCYCGAGWLKQVWEGITGQPVRVEVIETVLRGDDHCRIAVHLPPDIPLE